MPKMFLSQMVYKIDWTHHFDHSLRGKLVENEFHISASTNFAWAYK